MYLLKFIDFDMSNIMKRPEKDLAIELFATQPD